MRFIEKYKLPKPNRGRVRVIVDDDRVVHDSTTIAGYVEVRYPDSPAFFQWARAISDFEVLAADDPVRIWRGRMLDLFDGLARCAPAYGD